MYRAVALLLPFKPMSPIINPYSAGIDFSRQNLPSVDESDVYSRSPHCKSKNISNGRRPIT